jgi:hypothetical protein
VGHATYRFPPEVLREHLSAARDRGESFDEAWPAALAAAMPAHYPRKEWSAILTGMERTWRSAFDRTDAPAVEVAAGLLAA